MLQLWQAPYFVRPGRKVIRRRSATAAACGMTGHCALLLGTQRRRSSLYGTGRCHIAAQAAEAEQRRRGEQLAAGWYAVCGLHGLPARSTATCAQPLGPTGAETCSNAHGVRPGQLVIQAVQHCQERRATYRERNACNCDRLRPSQYLKAHRFLPMIDFSPAKSRCRTCAPYPSMVRPQPEHYAPRRPWISRLLPKPSEPAGTSSECMAPGAQ